MEVDVAAPVQVTASKTIGPKDFVDDAALPHIVALLEQNSRLAARRQRSGRRRSSYWRPSSTSWTPAMTSTTRPRKFGRRLIIPKCRESL
jgi:hypothetical protein